MDKLIGLDDDENLKNSADLGSDEEFFGGAGGAHGESDSESEEEEDPRPQKSGKKSVRQDAFEESDDDEEEEEEDKEEEPHKRTTKADEEQQKNINELYRKSKLQLLKDKKPKGKTGVVYLSKIPPYMKPTKMRQILTRFGEVDRLFMRRESPEKYKQRIKNGGNKKPMYEEGWAEFIRKKDAKLAADTLNGNTLGGKKGSFYYDDVMNVKYLSGFKWSDLTEQMSRENEIRQSKLQMEISQARKLNKTFVTNVQKSKMIEKMKSKKGDGDEDEVRRTFEQRRVTTARADAQEKHKQKESMPGLLSNVL